jgi:hypothetical protein
MEFTVTKPIELPASIKALRFEMLKQKLMDAEEGPGWDRSTCDYAEAEYKRFLFLKLLYPSKEIVPNRAVDQFWHQHILDTVAYAADCDAVFGAFLHHFPYFGMNGAEDEQNLIDAFEETKRLYLLHFNEEFAGESVKCRTKCKPMKCK